MKLARRGFLAMAAALLPAPMVMAQGRARVVVIGGGAGGATAAARLVADSGGALAVTLLTPERRYHSCFFSNLYLGGLRDFETLGHGYDGIGAGIEVIHDEAAGIDLAARRIALAGGGRLDYDRLVIAPGIDFVAGSVPGWDLSAQDLMPHAYKGGEQVQLLKAQIEAMPQGGSFVMLAPPNPYRCPPGPYERVSMVAHLLSRTNPTARILIVDPKDSFAKQALFEEGWQRHYPGMITRIGPELGAANLEVRPGAMEVVIDGSVEKADVCNVIPAQRAGQIAVAAGLADDSGWAPVAPEDMRSRLDPNVFVLGDAAAQGDMPKSAFAAGSQARVAASAIRAELTGSRAFGARYTNTCWSLIAPDDGVKVGASYRPEGGKITTVESFVSAAGESDEIRRRTYLESLDWYRAMTLGMFGPPAAG